MDLPEVLIVLILYLQASDLRYAPNFVFIYFYILYEIKFYI